MASLPTRITASFFAIQPIPSATPLDNEFNQYVGAAGIFNGGTTGTKLLTKTSDATDPVYEFDQVGAGPVIECKVNGVLKVSVNNAGQIVSDVTTGTAPLDVDSTTKVTNLNADKVDGFDLIGDKTAWSFSWTYPILPGAVETTESVGRFIVPAGQDITIVDITSVWAAGSDSAASNIFTIKRRNSAGTLQTDVGTIDVNSGAKDALNPNNISDVPLTAGDQIYPLFTTRNVASETIVTITVRGTQKFTT